MDILIAVLPGEAALLIYVIVVSSKNKYMSFEGKVCLNLITILV